MSKLWLIIDVPCLAHRALHSTGDLDDGVAFGVLAEVQRLRVRYNPHGWAFAFDSAISERELRDPAYKEARRQKYAGMTEEERKARWDMHQQVRQLRKEILPDLGFANVFRQTGYEADDVIASVVQRSLSPADQAVAVSSDKDLWQLLEGERVVQYRPHKGDLYTEARLRLEYGVHPSRWAEALALAGDDVDGVTGIDGIGLKTACQFLRDPARVSARRLALIDEHGEQALRGNLPLVRLPFAGCPTFSLRPDDNTHGQWRAVCKRLGFTSLLEV